MSLRDYTDQELADELESRKNKPQLLPNRDWSRLEEYVKSAIDKKSEPKDFHHYVFEYVLTIMYGDNIWQWYNRHFH